MASNIFQGKFLRVVQEEVLLPNGHRTSVDMVFHPGGACVLPIFDNGDILLIRQYRHAVQNYLWEIPAGKLNLNEDPLACAKRELEEEAGLQAKTWKKLISIYTTPGFCDEVLHIYSATGLTQVPTRQEAGEIMTIHRLDRKKIHAMLQQGEIIDSKTLAALFVFLNFMVD